MFCWYQNISSADAKVVFCKIAFCHGIDDGDDDGDDDDNDDDDDDEGRSRAGEDQISALQLSVGF